MGQLLQLVVNGERRELVVDPRQTLLEALRDGLHLTGTKEGCGNGNCGTCTVHLAGRPVLACLVLALEAQGQEVTTIEGIAERGRLDPLQQAFINTGAFECGYCTPGMIMAAKALLTGNPHPAEADIRSAIAGNLCRCTGYDKIVRAIMAAAEV